jgi:rfaE bifunctional protein nucleotidyltransferase chain/domain
MSDKLLTKKQLKLISIKLKKQKKKIILVHGVFDVVHFGHISHFQEAKSHGDILVVSITPDRFVKKGFNKPYFNELQRAHFLSSLETIDYVIINDNKSSISVINELKPSIYCKGPDYSKKSGDIAGNLGAEKNAVEKFGGRLIFTKGKLYSSTKILNNNFEDFNLGKKKIDEIYKDQSDKIYALNEFNKALNKVKNEKILIIGEIIFDVYNHSTQLGTPSKENILSVKFENKKKYFGGTIPVVNTISEISKNVTFASLMKSKSIHKILKRNINQNVKTKFFYEKNFKDIFKTRFIDVNNRKKFFEYYDFNNIEYFNLALKNYLNKNIRKFDKVIICDFGHGLFNSEIINLIQNKAKFICANIQTNSGNRGFNLFTKYSKLDLLCVDEPELRLGLKEKFTPIDKLIKNNYLKKYKNIIVTRGINGLIIKLYNSKNKFLEFPALNNKAIDTMGAGDAVYSYCASLIKNTYNQKIIAIAGSIAGAIKVNILGHSKNVKIEDVKRSFDTILK